MDDIFEVCKKCGNCCKETIPMVSEHDIRRWKREKRSDIINALEDHYLWKRIKSSEGACFFFDGVGCKIHETKPEACKNFPHNEEAAKKLKCKLYSNKVKSSKKK